MTAGAVQAARAAPNAPWRVAPRLRPLDLHLLVLDVDEVLADGLAAGDLVGEGEEAEAAGLFLLLVVHDDDLDDLAVAGEEGAEVRLRYRGREAAEKYLK